MKSLLELKVQPGESLSAERWNALLDWLRASQVMSGPGVLVSRKPTGTFLTLAPVAVDGPGAFAVSLVAGAGGKGQGVQVGRGLIEGIEPVIGTGDKGVKISGDAAAKPAVAVPTLALPEAAKAEGYLYFKVTIEKDSWRMSRAEVLFQEKPPAGEAWVAWKLLAILGRVGSTGKMWRLAHQAVHFNLGHYAYGRRSSGKARHLFFAR
jgi:hypothetical protein